MFKRITSILLSVAITFSAVGAAIMLPAMADNGFTPQHMEVDFSDYEVKDSVTYPNSNNTYASADANPSCLWSIKEDNGNKYLECNKSNSLTNTGSGYYSFILNPKGVAGNSKTDTSFTKDAEIFSLEDGARYRLTFRYKLPTMWNDKEIRVKIGASGVGSVGYNDGTLSYSLTDDDTAEGPVKLKTGNGWQTATVECTVKAKGWKNMVDSLVVGFILTNSTTGNPTGDGAYKLSVDDFVIDRLGAAEITDTDGNTETVYGVPACNPEYKAGFGICDAESVPFSESYENKSDYENGNYTASAKVIKYYSDKQLTTPITSAVFMPSVSKYYCNKIYETLAEDQVAFCGFDEHNLRKSFDISGTSTALRNWDSFVKCGYRNKKWSISSAEAFTGTKSVYINTTEWDSDTTQRSRYLYVGNGYELEPGKTYNISLWVKRDTSKTQTADLNIGFVNAGDFNSPNWLKGAKILNADFNGEWQQIVFENVKIPETQSNENYTLPYGYYMAPVLQIASDNAFWLDTVVINEVVKNEYWSGTEAANYAGGSGTAEDPYQISTPEELALLCKTVKESKWGSYEQSTKGKYYVLTKDIKINDTSKANWKDTAKEWYTNDKSVSSTPCFKGVFDGKGHKISGIYINNSASGSTGGLFIQIGKGAVVKNVGIENSYIKSNGNAGSIAGSVMLEDDSADKDAAMPRIVACYGGENVVIDGGDGYAGGIFGSCASFAELRYCYFVGDVVSSDAKKVGGLVGGSWGGGNENTKGSLTYRSCYSAPKNNQSLTSGKSTGTQATNVYATSNKLSDGSAWSDITVLSIDKMKGNSATQNMTALDFGQVWKTENNKTPSLRVFESGYTGADPDSIKDAFEEDYYDDAKPGDVWSGKVASKYHAGKGTAEDPYQIATAEELAKLCLSVKKSKSNEYDKTTKGKYFVLTHDIVLNDTSSSNWKASAKQWYSSAEAVPAFKGVFDGKGHTVSGVYIDNKADKSKGGLFIQIGKGAVVKNVGIENSYIKATSSSGGIAGAVMFEDESADKGAAAPKLIACYGGENVTIDGGDGYAGGMFGSCARFAELRYCYFIGTVTSTKAEKIGGLVGANWPGGNEGTKGNVTYRSCYSAPKNEKNFTGGKSNGTKATNSYATFNKNSKNTTILGGLNILAVERMTGNEALQFMKKFDFNQVWRVVEGRTPTLRVFEPDFKGTDPEFVNDAYEMQVYDGAKPGDIWTGKISSKYASGTGKKDDPYIIETAEQFALLAYKVNNSYWDNYLTEGVYYKLTADIKLNDVSSANWYENGNLNGWFTGALQDQAFCGHLDGNGYVISGVYINSEDAKFAGLFPTAGRKSVLENIGLIDSYIVTETGYSGGLYAYVENRSFDKNSPVVRNCFVGENVYIDSPSNAGGIVGALPSTITIENCYFLGDFGPTTNPNRIGGAYGFSWYSGKYTYKDSGEMIKTVVKNMFVCNTAKDRVIGGRANPNIPDMEFSNLFALRSHGGVSTMIGFSNMTDQKAAKYLTGFDFKNDWETVEKSTPILKIFANKGHDISRLVRVKGPVTITFETYGGTELEPMSAYSGSSLQLPTPTRNKDVFDGWYVYPLKTFDVPFNYDFFPDDDVTLYAKWIDAGITQDFEEYTYTADEDGMEEGYEVSKPGSIGYNGEYVKSGIRSLHRLNTVEEYKNACIFSAKDSKLVPGTEYEISMYVYLKDKPKADDKIMLAYTQYADWAFDENATQELGKLSDISTGSWQYVKYKFVAYSEYVAFRLPAVEMFIDDVYILTTDRANLKSDAVKTLPKTVTTVIDVDNSSADTNANTSNTNNNTVKTGKKKIIRKIIKKRANTDNTNYTLYFVIAGAAVVLAGAATTAVIVVRKKRKNIKI